MEHSDFGARFGFLLWRHHLLAGQPPSLEAIGKAVGRSGVAVGAWRASLDAPPDWRVQEALIAFFALENDRWLVRGQGEAPDPELWRMWRQRRNQIMHGLPTKAAEPPAYYGKQPSQETPVKKKTAAKKPRKTG